MDESIVVVESVVEEVVDAAPILVEGVVTCIQQVQEALPFVPVELSKAASEFYGFLLVKPELVGNLFEHLNGAGSYALLSQFEQFQLLLLGNGLALAFIGLFVWLLVFLVRFALSVFR